MASNRKIESLLKSLDLKVDPSTIVQIKDLLEKIEASSISSDSLDIDFTDTLSYVTQESYEINIGKEFLGSWQNLVFTGDVLGSVITSDNHSIFNIVGDGETEIDPIGLSFPDQLSGQLLKITSGDLSGSLLSSLIKYSDDTALGGDERFLNFRESIFIDPSSGDVTEIIDGYLIDTSASSYEITKTNNSGEGIKLELANDATGFKISNDLSDSSASVLKVDDNNGDTRLEVKNDGVTLSDLTIDFTDTLSYITEEDYEIAFGKAYISPLGWQDLVFVSNFIGSSIVEDNYSIFNFVGDGSTQIGSLGISFPSQVSGQLLTVNSGSLSGSSLINALTYADSTVLGGEEQFLDQKISVWVDPVGGDISWFTFQNVIDENNATSSWAKRNNAGESIDLKLDDSQEGFKISNDLSDNTASVLRIEDNNGDAILEFFNDYLVSETIPALDYANDVAAALGGVPVGGIYHNLGTIRIRLT